MARDWSEEYLPEDYQYMDVIDPFDMLQEFIDKSEQFTGLHPDPDYEDLVEEEHVELQDALVDGTDDAHILKEICDSIYVLIGLAIQRGYRIAPAFRDVHISNMSKSVNGVFQRNSSGKIIKGPNYAKPDLSGYV